MELVGVHSWVAAGFTVLQCLPAPSPGHGLTALARHCDTAVEEFVKSLEPEARPGQFVLLGAGLGANIALLMSLERFSQLVLVDSEPVLPGLVWAQPHSLARIFLSPPGPAFSEATVARAWGESGLAMVGRIKHNVLLVTTEDPQLVRIYQVRPPPLSLSLSLSHDLLCSGRHAGLLPES